MNTALIYVSSHILSRVFLFFRHWYYDGLLMYLGFGYAVFRRIDKRVALLITARYFFTPLYQDYSIIGYIFGFLFRSIRLSIGILIYGLLLPPFLLLYVVWAGVPLFIIFNILFS